MSLTVSCAGCLRHIKVREEIAGRKVKCPNCQEIMLVPGGLAISGTDRPSNRASPRAQTANGGLGSQGSPRKVEPETKFPGDPRLEQWEKWADKKLRKYLF